MKTNLLSIIHFPLSIIRASRSLENICSARLHHRFRCVRRDLYLSPFAIRRLIRRIVAQIIKLTEFLRDFSENFRQIRCRVGVEKLAARAVCQ